MTLDPQSFGPDAARLRSVRLVGGVATLVVDATGLGDTDRAALEARLKAIALGQPEVDEARVAMTASKAAGPKLIAVGSGKGGVGKSTVSVNLAIALARLGHKVGIIDADIYGPSQPTLLGTNERPEARDKKLIPVEAQGVRLLSVGQLVSPGHALAWRGPMASGALAQLVEGDWTGTELIIVDLPPGTGDVQLSLIQKSRPVGAVVVSTPQDLALIDARRAIDLFGKTSVPVLGIIENMAGYQCPSCGETSDPFGSGGAEAAAGELGVPFLGRLPLSASLRAESDAGRPPAAGEGPAAAAFRTLAEAVLAQLDG
ncbi:ATP-binding protein involved in chromosome partitioning [Sphingomonas kaistensis]|uniref:Iron-sulfur cluster carrier protein n=1 Tax=Sphingomonas kaistensis TaxID=298708 RepID=A0A7X5Y5P8_9SPHN|nr:P-loop NTPase [Sphingomonas kaistensis]NJC05295.1 ATP-binding protein involved in chromosome partitioning [Sphingomonas kaistensis]